MYDEYEYKSYIPYVKYDTGDNMSYSSLSLSEDQEQLYVYDVNKSSWNTIAQTIKSFPDLNRLLLVKKGTPAIAHDLLITKNVFVKIFTSMDSVFADPNIIDPRDIDNFTLSRILGMAKLDDDLSNYAEDSSLDDFYYLQKDGWILFVPNCLTNTD